MTTHHTTLRSLASLSVEEQNLAAIPFAVLERRVGKRSKIELEGTKTLPDGREVQVRWQVQGNPELGLPTEQDLDIFVALGVLTFQNNFQKTVTFTGRQLAGLLNISAVHGKFYRRLKLAIDRFIPLRFRAITATEHEEDIKWINVFQEASFTLDRTTGVCNGSITWTDKVIQSMDYGFFRFLDADRYMDLDGITAKHLYRYLAGAFEKQPVIVANARELAQTRLGMINPPQYFSRLMQTLEPAFDQLIRNQVMSSYHVVSQKEWTVALVRHPNYAGESQRLLSVPEPASLEICLGNALKLLQRNGLATRKVELLSETVRNWDGVFLLDRAAHLVEALREEDVMPHVAVSMIRKPLEACLDGGAEQIDEAREALDGCEIALQVCREKKAMGQQLKNPAGFLVKLIKDPEARQRSISAEREQHARSLFRQREQAALRQRKESEQQELIFEYEQFRQKLAHDAFQELPESRRKLLRKQKEDLLKQQGNRLERIPRTQQEQEIDDLVLSDLAATESPSFERWYLRRRAQQAVLPFQEPALTNAGM